MERKSPQISFTSHASDGTSCVIEAFTDVPLPYATVETLLTDMMPPKTPVLPFMQVAIGAMPQDIPEISMPFAAAMTGLMFLLDFENYRPHPDDNVSAGLTFDDDDDDGDGDLVGVLA